VSELQQNKIVLAQLIQDFNQRGWSPATSTNYSLRENYDSDTFWVSKSGKDKANFTENDFMEVDLAGNPTAEFSEIKPSAETLIHCAIYEMFPFTTCIVHSHSKDSVCISEQLKTEFVLKGYEVQKAFEGETTHDAELKIPIFENTQDIIAFSRILKENKSILQNHSFIMRKHGTYAWGKSIADAKRHLEALEYLISCELILRF
jgi:methylthioribulose-1-phosphate dehydratase